MFRLSSRRKKVFAENDLLGARKKYDLKVVVMSPTLKLAI